MGKINRIRDESLENRGGNLKEERKNESDIQNGITYKPKKEKQMQQEEKYLQNLEENY